jgi:hypothetical protein
LLIVEGRLLAFEPFDLGVDDFAAVGVVVLIRSMQFSIENSLCFLNLTRIDCNARAKESDCRQGFASSWIPPPTLTPTTGLPVAPPLSKHTPMGASATLPGRLLSVRRTSKILKELEKVQRCHKSQTTRRHKLQQFQEQELWTLKGLDIIFAQAGKPWCFNFEETTSTSVIMSL